MPTNRPSAVNLGEIGVCVMRAAALDSDCTPLGGNGSGIVTAGLIDATATPDIQEGTVFEPTNGCGTTLYKFQRQNRIRGYNLAGNLGFFDDEFMYLAFGGSVVLGKAGGAFPGDTIGWAAPNYNAAASNGVYFEVISQVIGEGAGDCITSGTGFPRYVGYIFGKVLMTPGELSFSDDARQLPFTGIATSNPNLYDGPWNDFPGQGYIPNSPMVRVGYTEAEYQAILATVAAGHKDLPVGS